MQGSVRWSLGEASDLYKLDSTVGLKFTDQFTGLVALNLSYQDGETTSKLAPALLFSHRRLPFDIKVGTSSPLDDPGVTSVEVGLWRRF